jgi:hypothetical protein
MEIASFLRFRPSWRQVVFVVFVTLVAAGAAGYLAHRSAATYNGKAIVLMAQLFPPNTPNYSISPFVDDFQTVLTTPKVVDQTAQLTGDSAKKITSGLTSNSVGSTLDVEVDYSSMKPDAAVGVVTNASRLALELLAHDRLTSDQRAASQANQDFNTATAALATYQAAHGADGSVTFNNLTANVARTQSRAATASNQVSDDQLQVLAAQSSQTLSVEGPTKQSRLTSEIQSAASTAVIAAAVSTLLLLAFSWRRRPRIRWRADAGARTRTS